jgi:hypothetical protein
MLLKIDRKQLDKALELASEYILQSTISVNMIFLEAEVIDELRPLWKLVFVIDSYYTFSDPYIYFAVDVPSQKVLSISSMWGINHILKELELNG